MAGQFPLCEAASNLYLADNDQKGQTIYYLMSKEEYPVPVTWEALSQLEMAQDAMDFSSDTTESEGQTLPLKRFSTQALVALAAWLMHSCKEKREKDEDWRDFLDAQRTKKEEHLALMRLKEEENALKRDQMADEIKANAALRDWTERDNVVRGVNNPLPPLICPPEPNHAAELAATEFIYDLAKSRGLIHIQVMLAFLKHNVPGESLERVRRRKFRIQEFNAEAEASCSGRAVSYRWQGAFETRFWKVYDDVAVELGFMADFLCYSDLHKSFIMSRAMLYKYREEELQNLLSKTQSSIEEKYKGCSEEVLKEIEDLKNHTGKIFFS